MPPSSTVYVPWYDTSGTPTYGFTCNSTESYVARTEPIYYWERLVRISWRKLTQAEKAVIRKMNFEPTRKGIKLCVAWHEKVLSMLRSLPGLQVRFDRRIPCWRAGRWKSLTA